MTGSDRQTGTGAGDRTRREVLATVGAAGTIGLAGCGGGGGGDDGGDTTEQQDDTVRIGAAIPQSGTYGNEGEELQAGYLLAVRHVNDASGAIATTPFEDIGGGVTGENVELVIENTESSSDGARRAAESILAEGNVDVLVGGTSRDEAVALQEVATQEEVVYMGGFTPTNAMGGEHCSQYGFNEIHNPPMMAEALRTTVAGELGPESEVNYAQLYPDNEVGAEFENAFDRFDQIGEEWFHQSRANVATRVGAQDYSGPIEDINAVGPDMVILNYYGLDAASVLREAVSQLEDVLVVMPLMNHVFARNAGSALENVVGTVHWHPAVGGEFSDAFVDSWSDIAADDDGLESPPSATAHVAYVQLAQWAAAAERAGSTDPDAVVGELEDREYNVGLGDATLRACDHQAQRDVPVVSGLSQAQQSAGNYFELETVASNVGYSCSDGPAADCDR